LAYLYDGGECRGKNAHPQQQKMSDCNKEASSKSLKGDERKTFMSQCLKKDAPRRKVRG
jgi:hypothetical protein